MQHYILITQVLTINDLNLKCYDIVNMPAPMSVGPVAGRVRQVWACALHSRTVTTTSCSSATAWSSPACCSSWPSCRSRGRAPPPLTAPRRPPPPSGGMGERGRDVWRGEEQSEEEEEGGRGRRAPLALGSLLTPSTTFRQGPSLLIKLH